MANNEVVCGSSIPVKQSANQQKEGGSTLTLPLHDLHFSVSNIQEIRPFIEKWHYSHNINGVKVSHCFSVKFGNRLVGASLFGALATTAWKRYAKSESEVIELRRLVLLDDVAKNAESRFVGWTLRWMRKNTKFKVVISYADPYYGHAGTIYRASNFEYLGRTPKDVKLRHPNGKLYHSRALRTRYKGEYKPFVKELRRLNEAGLLASVIVPGKHIYKFTLMGSHEFGRVAQMHRAVLP